MLQTRLMLLIPLFLIVSDIAPAMTTAATEQNTVQSIALYYKPDCPHSQKVLAYMRSQNISIPIKNVMQDKEAKEQLRTIGGHMIVPCLIVDGKPIYEDRAIIQWLSDNRKTIPSNLKSS